MQPFAIVLQLLKAFPLHGLATAANGFSDNSTLWHFKPADSIGKNSVNP